MKKIILAIGLLVFTGIFTSCTDTAEEVEKNAKFEERLYTNPENDGQIDNEEDEETGYE
ncbi:hypothetical protein V2647_07630 [Tenacibaculum maritimum]|uniref:hypothetical protein n=1 Tax=Tenacibaculum maritimum TaxID=107401 RepID=UPI0012E4A37D|nr:hypothetical protein [Tenacibaculum maritimum]CAA0221694.1 Probable lipoprotein precursor [Tenacibaculum maritimum]